MAACGIGGLLSACARMLAAPFALVGRLFRKRGDLRQAGKNLKSAILRVDPHEEQIKTSSKALRTILQNLSVVIQRTDQVASSSNQTLGDVRNSIGQMDIPKDLEEDHNLLMREIDRVISANTALKQELSSSQNILASQRQQIEELRTAVRLDGLTQLANRAYFDEKLVEMINLRRRYK